MPIGEPEVRRGSAMVAFGVALVVSVLLAAAVFVPFWKPLVLAAILATASYGPYCRLTRWLGGRQRLAATFMTLAVVLLVLFPVIVIVSFAVREAIDAYAYVMSALRLGGVGELTARLPDSIEGPARSLAESLAVQEPGSAAGGGMTLARILRDVVATVSRLIFSMAMMLIAYFALLTDGMRLLAWIEDVSPLRGRQTIELLSEFRRVSRSVLRSTVLTAAAQSVVAGVGYLVAGVPSVVFFTFLTFFAAFIPSVGTAVVALPLAVVLLLTGNTWQGIFLAVWALAVVGLVDNLLKPMLIRGEMQLNGVVVFFSLVGGVLVFGAIGLLLGPLSVTFFLTMIRFGYRDFSTRLRPGEREDAPAPAQPHHIAD